REANAFSLTELGLVPDRQPLAAVAEAAVQFAGAGFEVGDCGGAGGDDLGAVRDELLVPDAELVGGGAALLNVLQQRVALLHHPLVAWERTQVGVVHLREGDVQVAAAAGGRAGD